MARGRPRTQLNPCLYCGKQFKRREHLERHERTHTLEKPYSCKDCCQSFSRKDLLARHVKLAHAVQAAKSQPKDGEHPSRSTSLPPSADVANGATSTFQPTHQDSVPDVGSSAAAASHFGSGSPGAHLHDGANSNALHGNVEPYTNIHTAHGNPLISQGHEGDELGDYSQLQPLVPNAPDEGFNSLFSGIDGIDWLWNNDISDAYLPTTLFDMDPALLGGGFQDSLAPTASNHLGSDPRSVVGNATQKTYSSTGPRDEPIEQGGVPHAPGSHPVPHSGSHDRPDAHRRATAWSPDRELAPMGDTTTNYPWRISAPMYERITAAVARRSRILSSDFVLPSRHTLSRYVEGYFRGYHVHLPFLHAATIVLSDVPEELLLAIAAVGALYKFEHGKGYELYFAARALVSYRLQEQNWESSRHLVGNSPSYTGVSNHLRPRSGNRTGIGSSSSSSGSSGPPGPSFLETPLNVTRIVQTLTILVSVASWGEGTLVPEALEMGSQLVLLLRTAGISEPDNVPPDVQWKDWIGIEERRRTMLVGYTVTTLHCVAFNIPPPVMNQEVALFLPHRMDLWVASTEDEWLDTRRKQTHTERQFKEVLGTLLSGNKVERPTEVSAFGNYIVIHGLVQHIFTERQISSLRTSGPSLEPTTITSLDASLRSWQQCWRSSSESSLDPLSSNGPLAFNSTALLRIAYIRLNVDLGPRRSVITRNPVCLARSVAETPTTLIERSAHTELAVLQCIHALGILVRAGVAFVSRTHAHSWSIVHSLGNIECACFLSLWLRNIASVVQLQGTQSLREEERRLLGMITSVVGETTLGPAVHGEPDGTAKIQKLAACTVRIWADALQGDHVFEMVHTIAKGMSLAANILDERLDGT